MALLEASGLEKTFSRSGKTVTALHDINLEIETGEFVSIVGPSGCGKSTFLNLVGGFEPQSSGALLLDGEPIVRPGPDRGMVFQDYTLFPWRTVFGNIVWGLEAQGVPKQRRIEIADNLLSMVGLARFRDHYPSELSGGMKQRVALARVLAYDPKLLLMDEPFGALDAQTRELMQEELQAIWEENRKTVLLITHDIDEAIFLSDRILVFTAQPGRIKEEIRIDLPRPREASCRTTPEYYGYRARVWELLRAEVLQARELQ